MLGAIVFIKPCVRYQQQQAICHQAYRLPPLVAVGRRFQYGLVGLYAVGRRTPVSPLQN